MSSEKIRENFQIRVFNFFKKNKTLFIALLIATLIGIFSFLVYKNMQIKKNIKIAQQYTQASILLNQKKITESELLLEAIIEKNHKFYSPLALYLLIESNIENDTSKIISYFDIVLKNKSIDKENLNLIKIKKAIYLFDSQNEKLIIETLNPIINSNSVWKKMAIDLISDYFLSLGQKVKAEEYIQLLNIQSNK
jgi:predicted negative regulator of RcsB-dependent stress response|tara:strand:- start:2338 stop:2919 length:582 start_codon:yes stop_codon:yes gene_type:complete